MQPQDKVIDIQPLAERCPRLTTLQIGGVQPEAMGGFSKFKDLKHLDVKGDDLSQEHIDALLKTLPKLEYLKVNYKTIKGSK